MPEFRYKPESRHFSCNPVRGKTFFAVQKGRQDRDSIRRRYFRMFSERKRGFIVISGKIQFTVSGRNYFKENGEEYVKMRLKMAERR